MLSARQQARHAYKAARDDGLTPEQAAIVGDQVFRDAKRRAHQARPTMTCEVCGKARASHELQVIEDAFGVQIVCRDCDMEGPAS